MNNIDLISDLATAVRAPKGRALDSLIAMRVFGWTDLTWHDPNHPHFDLHGNPPGERNVIQHVPDYSANMDFAMDVVKKLALDGHTMRLEWKGEDREYAHSVEVEFNKIYITGHAVGTDVPEAICLAALEAVNHENNL